jgi:hypothetical protein
MNIGLASSSTVTCVVTDSIGNWKATATSIINWNAYFPEIVASVSPTTSNATGSGNQKSGTYTVTASGGSNSFSYAWTTSGGNVLSIIASAPTSATTFFTGSISSGSSSYSTATCTITDTVSGITKTVTATINWAAFYEPVILTITPTTSTATANSSSSIQTSGTYAVTFTGGSGTVTYAWTYTGGNVSSIAISAPSSASSFFTGTMTVGAASTSTVKCTVTDATAGQTVEITATINWLKYY